jgi:hypothetical protein
MLITHSYLATSMKAAVALDLILNAEVGRRSLFDVVINFNRQNQFDHVEKDWSRLHCDDLELDFPIELNCVCHVDVEKVCLRMGMEMYVDSERYSVSL